MDVKIKTNLLDVSASDKLGSEVEVLTLGLLKIKADIVVGLFEIALVGVEHDGLVQIMFPHHFKSDSGDGWLEIGLLCVNHYADVQLLGKLYTN
jgi:hypothetical protein